MSPKPTERLPKPAQLQGFRTERLTAQRGLIGFPRVPDRIYWTQLALTLDQQRHRVRLDRRRHVVRPQLGMMATGVADLNLHVAVMLRDLQLPAALARHVLTAAVQDFVDNVKPTDAFDWLTLARAAQQVSREQVEDYVASAAADGPLLPLATAGPGSLWR